MTFSRYPGKCVPRADACNAGGRPGCHLTPRHKWAIVLKKRVLLIAVQPEPAWTIVITDASRQLRNQFDTLEPFGVLTAVRQKLQIPLDKYALNLMTMWQLLFPVAEKRLCDRVIQWRKVSFKKKVPPQIKTLPNGQIEWGILANSGSAALSCHLPFTEDVG